MSQNQLIGDHSVCLSVSLSQHICLSIKMEIMQSWIIDRWTAYTSLKSFARPSLVVNIIGPSTVAQQIRLPLVMQTPRFEVLHWVLAVPVSIHLPANVPVKEKKKVVLMLLPFARETQWSSWPVTGHCGYLCLSLSGALPLRITKSLKKDSVATIKFNLYFCNTKV